MTRLLVEVRDFVHAARTMYDGAAEPARVACGRTGEALVGLSAIAGDDPGGQDWSRCYDEAAAATLHATQQAVNAAYKVSSMLGRTAMNYAQAEAASTAAPASEQHSVTALIQSLPGDASIGPAPTPPSAAGGGGDTPTGWWLVEHTLGYVWPNGHQDKLHDAASAWTASAGALDKAAAEAGLAGIGFDASGIPEGDDIRTVCIGMTEHLMDLAQAHRSLATACTELAHHIDECHSAVIGELEDLIAWTAGIQAGGAILSVFTFGAAEAPTQAAQAAKTAAAAARIGVLIERFIALARTVAASIRSVAMTADRVAGELLKLNDVTLSAATVLTVRTLPGVVKLRELAATNRLSAAARGLPALALPSGQLAKKFKHAGDFGVLLKRSKEGFGAFGEALDKFVNDARTIRISASKGRYGDAPATLSYNPDSRLVVVQHADGTFWSAWKMDPRQLYYVRKYGILK